MTHDGINTFSKENLIKHVKGFSRFSLHFETNFCVNKMRNSIKWMSTTFSFDDRIWKKKNNTNRILEIFGWLTQNKSH